VTSHSSVARFSSTLLAAVINTVVEKSVTMMLPRESRPDEKKRARLSDGDIGGKSSHPSVSTIRWKVQVGCQEV
jgi:hypothetical protein